MPLPQANKSERKIECEIVQKLKVLSTSAKGYTKELNIVSWNGRPAKYDLREWSPDGKPSKGVTFGEEEARLIVAALSEDLSQAPEKRDVPEGFEVLAEEDLPF